LQATEEPASQRSSECSRAGKASRGGTDGTDGGGGPGTSGGARVRPPAGGGWAVLRIVRPGPHTLPPCSFDSCWRWRTLTSATRAQQKPLGAKFCAVRPRPTPVPLPSSPPEQHGGHRRAGRIVTDEGCRHVGLWCSVRCWGPSAVNLFQNIYGLYDQAGIVCAHITFESNFVQTKAKIKLPTCRSAV
jgi:hypothetical protein